MEKAAYFQDATIDGKVHSIQGEAKEKERENWEEDNVKDGEEEEEREGGSPSSWFATDIWNYLGHENGKDRKGKGNVL